MFNCKFANAQPHSGAQANGAVFLALLNPGDTFLGMSLNSGGHITHGLKISMSGKWFNAIGYDVDKKTELIDYDKVEKLALEAHNALGCKGISRTDFILEKQSKIFYILEVNTQPGMTPTSLVPEIAKSKGTDFDELINWILNDASTNR